MSTGYATFLYRSYSLELWSFPLLSCRFLLADMHLATPALLSLRVILCISRVRFLFAQPTMIKSCMSLSAPTILTWKEQFSHPLCTLPAQEGWHYKTQTDNKAFIKCIWTLVIKFKWTSAWANLFYLNVWIHRHLYTWICQVASLRGSLNQQNCLYNMNMWSLLICMKYS